MPEEIISGSDTIFYTYSSTGEKLRKLVSYNGTSGIEKDYVGSFIYSGGNLDFILTSEGRICADMSGNYNYEYFIKDHLGNIRVSFWDSSGVAAINQETSYYPFGMVMYQWDYASSNEFLYNGKEIQDELGLDWYDYGARMYDPVIGRWNVIDNKAEKYHFTSPYTYALNNPILLIDPDGNEVVNPNKIVINNSRVISAVKAANLLIAKRTGLSNDQFTIRISGGDRYKGDDNKIYSLSNGKEIKNSASASRHLIEEGARAIDLQIDNSGDGKVTSELLREVLEELGATYIKDDYDDSHTHAQFSEDMSEEGLTKEDKNTPTKDDFNKNLSLDDINNVTGKKVFGILEAIKIMRKEPKKEDEQKEE